MTRTTQTKTSFTSGELDPRLIGRIDLRAYEEGAAKLRNVTVERTGGVSRRSGTRHVLDLPDISRVIALETASATRLVCFGPFVVHIVADGALLATIANTPWGEEALSDIDATQIGERLVICHSATPPHLLELSADATWILTPIAFATADPAAESGRSNQPFARYAPPEATLQPEILSPPDNPPDGVDGSLVQLVSSHPVFTADHLGTLVRVKGAQLRITNVPIGSDGTTAIAEAIDPLVDELATYRWDEQAFSEPHGWPRTVSHFQARLAFGGTRDAPDQLWLSATGRPFDFDTGEGLADQAISFRLRTSEHHEIRHLVAGERLQIFTSAGEWVVSGEPLTPERVRADLQTRIGSYRSRRIQPIDVDGATLFLGASGRDLREFLFTDTEQAYQAADIALLSRHLLIDPVDMDFDQRQRLILIARDDGALVGITIDRNANLLAWTLHETDGNFQAVCATREGVFLVVEREGETHLEAFEEDYSSDCAIVRTSPTPLLVWDGLEMFVGRRVALIGDGHFLGEVELQQPTILLAEPVSRLEVGLPFTHEITALPPSGPLGRSLPVDQPYRPYRLSLRLFETRHLELDTGSGIRSVSLDTSLTGSSQDIAVAAMGWRRGVRQPPWRIVQKISAPFTLLSASTSIRISD